MILIPKIGYIGDFKQKSTIYFIYNTLNSSGASVNRTSIVSTTIYRNDSTTGTTSGITETSAFDSIAGNVLLTIDTDNAYYLDKSDYSIVLAGVVLSTQTVNISIASFSLSNRYGSEQRHFQALQKIFQPKILLDE